MLRATPSLTIGAKHSRALSGGGCDAVDQASHDGRAGLGCAGGRRVGTERSRAVRARDQAADPAREVRLWRLPAAGQCGFRADRRDRRDTGQCLHRRQGEHAQDRQADGRRARLRPYEGHQRRRVAALRQAEDRGHDGRRGDVHRPHAVRRAAGAGRRGAGLPAGRRGQELHSQQAGDRPARPGQAGAQPGDRGHQREIERSRRRHG